jgi:hypothetical protein
MSFSADSKNTSQGTASGQIEREQRVSSDSFNMSERKGLSFALLLCWMTAFVAIAGSLFFWMLNNSVQAALSEKNDEKNSIIGEISSPTLAETEQKATSFKTAVNALSTVSKTRYPLDEFLTQFYAKIRQNIKVNNLIISEDGKLSIDGLTDSYRSVADQMLVLKDWKVNDLNILSDVSLLSVSEGMNDKTKRLEVTYSISAKIIKTQSLTEKTDSTSTTGDSTSTDTDTTSTTSDLSTEGGTNATIQ